MSVSYFYRQLFDPDAADSLGQRVQFLALELVLLVRAQYDLWAWAKIIPHQPAITAPSGIGHFIDVSFMLRDPLYAQVNAVLCGILMSLGILRRFSAAYALAFLSLAIQCAARYGLGKVQHGATMLGMALVALGIAHLAFKREDLRRKASIGLLVTLISLAYIFASGSKLYASGYRWANGRNLWLWIHQKRIDSISAGGDAALNWLQELSLKSKLFATLQLSFGLLAELSGWVLWWRPVRRWAMLSLAAMHFGISLVMKIFFIPSVLILLALALPIAELVDFVRARIKPQAPTPQPNSVPLANDVTESAL
jgi:hypothetical protein